MPKGDSCGDLALSWASAAHSEATARERPNLKRFRV